MVLGNDNNLLLNLCNTVYLNHVKHCIAVLDNMQTTQLNSLLQSDAGYFNLSFPAPNTMVIYNDHFRIEYVHLPEPIVKAYENPVKTREMIIKDAQEKELIRQRARFKATKEKRALEAKREEMQSRVFEKMGVRLKVQKNIPLEEVKKETAIENINKSNKQNALRGVLKSKVLISILLIIMLCVLAITILLTREKIHNDLTRKNIKGRVKSVKISNYYTVEKFDEIEKGTLKSKSIFKYNVKGNIENLNNYNANGSLSMKSTYRYDIKGNLDELSSYFSDSENSYRITYKYDTRGNIAEINTYNKSGSLIKYHKSNYDEKRNQTSSKTYDSDGSLNESFTYKYDNNNNLIEENTYNANGSLSKQVTNRYDNRGIIVEINSYEPEASVRVKLTYRYDKYDRKGNWISAMGFKNNNETIVITEREIEYY